MERQHHQLLLQRFCYSYAKLQLVVISNWSRSPTVEGPIRVELRRRDPQQLGVVVTDEIRPGSPTLKHKRYLFTSSVKRLSDLRPVLPLSISGDYQNHCTSVFHEAVLKRTPAWVEELLFQTSPSCAQSDWNALPKPPPHPSAQNVDHLPPATSNHIRSLPATLRRP